LQSAEVCIIFFFFFGSTNLFLTILTVGSAKHHALGQKYKTKEAELDLLLINKRVEFEKELERRQQEANVELEKKHQVLLSIATTLRLRNITDVII